MKRYSLGQGESEEMFTRSAMNVHPKNGLFMAGHMRGGIRL